MSKKTKRLEKENLSLTRKHDLTNRNILEMAEERTKVNKEMENIRKRNTTLESIVRRMQDQGRQPLEPPLAGEDEGTESEYDDEDYEDDGSEEGDYDDETEDEALQAQHRHSAHGAHQPNSAAHQHHVNGSHRAVNGKVNGVKQEVVI